MSPFILQIALGLLAALILIVWHRKGRLSTQVKLWGQALVIVALVYVVFNVVGQAWSLLPIELLGVAIYGGFAYLAWKHHPAWLGVGWLLHVAWDTLVHPLEGAHYVPGWYPGVCLGFDLAVGGYLLWLVFSSYKMSE